MYGEAMLKLAKVIDKTALKYDVDIIVTPQYEKIILLYSPSTYETADVISSYVYRMGIGDARYSFSSAVGIFQSVVNLILLVGTNMFSKKIVDTALF